MKDKKESAWNYSNQGKLCKGPIGKYFTTSNGIKLFTLQEIERHSLKTVTSWLVADASGLARDLGA